MELNSLTSQLNQARTAQNAVPATRPNGPSSVSTRPPADQSPTPRAVVVNNESTINNLPSMDAEAPKVGRYDDLIKLSRNANPGPEFKAKVEAELAKHSKRHLNV